jgi:anti-anti-sigma factor
MTPDRFDSSVNVDIPRQGVAVIELVGEHDLTTAEETSELLARLVNENDLVIVDLCSATFIDSSVLSYLVKADRQATERGHALRLLVCDAPIVESVLKLTALDELLTIVTDRGEI